MEKTGNVDELVNAIAQLSAVQKLEDVMGVVRLAARKLTGADGATFVLREDGNCYYAEENAISPLWKGMRFPMETCISGWCMLNKEQVVIPDIYVDERIPHDAYRPTFVKSLVMTPIRREEPIAAIGAYWQTYYAPSETELRALQSLADSASVALRNVEILENLKSKVQQLDKANQQLERLTWLASHDLKEPLRHISLAVDRMREHFGDGDRSLDEQTNKLLERMKSSSQQAHQLITDLLEVGSVKEKAASLKPVDLNSVLKRTLEVLRLSIEESGAEIDAQSLPTVMGEPSMLASVLRNLIQNAIKFRHKERALRIQIECEQQDAFWKIQIRDNGIGIDQKFHSKVFDFFTRIHSRAMYPGSGVGLAICKKIIEDFGGTMGVESELDKGSCFYFTMVRAV